MCSPLSMKGEIMNKKEMSEIRKQFSPENACITSIAKMLVSGEKEIIHSELVPFLSLSEDESVEILKLCKASLKGEFGKHLYNIEFPTEVELDPNSLHSILLGLRNNHMKEEEELNEYAQCIIDSYVHDSNYFITILNFTYDIPGKGEDEDSDEVFEGLLTMISDAKNPDIGMCFDSKGIGLFSQSLLKSSKPVHTFLFPAFDDRSTNVHSMLYCAGNPKKIANEVISEAFGCKDILTADEQKQKFQEAMTDATDMALKFDTAANINRELYIKAEESKAAAEDACLEPEDVARIIKDTDMDEETAERFEETYKELMEDNKAAANALVGSNVKIEVSDMVVNAKPELLDLITTKIVDNKRSLVIEIRGDLVMNGLSVS